MKIKLIVLFFFAFAVIGECGQKPDEIILVESVPEETIYGSSLTLRAKEVWLDMINSAEKSIDIEQFYLESASGGDLISVIEAIKTKAKEGVKVRVMFEKAMLHASGKYLSLFEGENIELRIIDFKKRHGGVQHAKFFIVDGKDSFVGSQNFDYRSLSQIHELGVRIKSKKAAKELQKIFAYDWVLAGKNKKENPRPVKISLSCEKPLKALFLGEEISYCLVFSPKSDKEYKSEIQQMLEIINSASKKIYAQVMTYSDKGGFKELENAFAAAAGRGVVVKLVFSDWALGPKKDSALRALASIENVEVKISSIPAHSKGFIPFSRVEHLKYLYADDKTFFVSTSNWGKDYFYSARGVGVVLMGNISKPAEDIFLRSFNAPYAFKFDPAASYESKKRD